MIRNPTKVHLYFGGSFDPFHNGHLRILINALEVTKACRVELMPSGLPPHKASPLFSPDQRIEMLERMVALFNARNQNLEFRVNTYEIEKKTPSYTYETLKKIRLDEGDDVSIIWLMGHDSFASFDTWEYWRELTRYANFLVAARGGQSYQIPNIIDAWAHDKWVRPSELGQKPSGYIARMDNPAFEVSSTLIRNKIAQNQWLDGLLPDEVIRYLVINKHFSHQ